MPSSFDDVRLDMDVERGAQGGPVFRTSVARLNSGHAKRAQLWTQPLGRWDIAYGLRQLDDDGALLGLRNIISFFYARRGRLRTFRFRDWLDYTVVDEQFATGDGVETVFQLTITYTDVALFNFIKNITKPAEIPAPVIKVDGVTQIETTDYTIDFATGLITFVTPPGDTLPITWTGEFDKHVSFEEDRLDIDIAIFYAGSIPAITIREERE